MGSDHPNILTGKTVAYAEQLTVTFMLNNNNHGGRKPYRLPPSDRVYRDSDGR